VSAVHAQHEDSTDEPKNQEKTGEDGMKPGIRETLTFSHKKPEDFWRVVREMRDDFEIINGRLLSGRASLPPHFFFVS
jgi:hypothetical protein